MSTRQPASLGVNLLKVKRAGDLAGGIQSLREALQQMGPDDSPEKETVLVALMEQSNAAKEYQNGIGWCDQLIELCDDPHRQSIYLVNSGSCRLGWQSVWWWASGVVAVLVVAR